jgi:hypothetical protein
MSPCDVSLYESLDRSPHKEISHRHFGKQQQQEVVKGAFTLCMQYYTIEQVFKYVFSFILLFVSLQLRKEFDEKGNTLQSSKEL